jgi:hypothetical protein
MVMARKGFYNEADMRTVMQREHREKRIVTTGRMELQIL